MPMADGPLSEGRTKQVVPNLAVLSLSIANDETFNCAFQ
jgi:hypothetical protein